MYASTFIASVILHAHSGQLLQEIKGCPHQYSTIIPTSTLVQDSKVCLILKVVNFTLSILIHNMDDIILYWGLLIFIILHQLKYHYASISCSILEILHPNEVLAFWVFHIILYSHSILYSLQPLRDYRDLHNKMPHLYSYFHVFLAKA